ncbi:TPA: Rho termination factor N-terminal domain-containing protein [Clostridium botulinum]|nr:Rho termination factor N-terminal domain-containing protein [Clostridium botulinum]
MKEQIDYESKTVTDLKVIAENKGIKVASNMLKADIIEAIKNIEA